MEIVRAFGIDAFVDDKVFPVFFYVPEHFRSEGSVKVLFRRNGLSSGEKFVSQTLHLS